MRTHLRVAAVALATACAACLAQHWEVDGVVGGGAYGSADLANRYGRASAGLAPGALFGASLVQHYYRYVSGEIRWAFQRSDLKVASGAETVKFRGSTHAIHYDWLFHARPREAPLRPFLAAGAGFKQFRGTGAESAYQPLGQFALLTRTQEWQPLITLGGGVRVRLSRRFWLTGELRDYLTPFPKKVIAPVGGARLDRWLHDLAPSVALGLRF
jgi:hypothetical protein